MALSTSSPSGTLSTGKYVGQMPYLKELGVSTWEPGDIADDFVGMLRSRCGRPALDGEAALGELPVKLGTLK
ncbi:hypothetical protein FRB98_003356, partial [Tulasnella sp. 332]